MSLDLHFILRLIGCLGHLAQHVDTLGGQLCGSARKKNLAGDRDLQLVLQAGNLDIFVRQLLLEALFKFYIGLGCRGGGSLQLFHLNLLVGQFFFQDLFFRSREILQLGQFGLGLLQLQGRFFGFFSLPPQLLGLGSCGVGRQVGFFDPGLQGGGFLLGLGQLTPGLEVAIEIIPTSSEPQNRRGG